MPTRCRVLKWLVWGFISQLFSADFVLSVDQPEPRKIGGGKLGGYTQPPPANDVPKRLFDIILGRPTDRAITARVLAYETLKGRIRYGTGENPFSSETPNIRLTAGEPIDFLISSLSPDSRYDYRFEFRRGQGASFDRSSDYTFHTQRAPNSSFTFTVQSDSHLDENTSPAVYERTLANALADHPDFHLELGDTFMVDKYVRPEISHGQYLAQRYYFGQLCHSAPLFFVLGNHDGEAGDRGSSLWPTLTRKRYFPNPFPNEFYTGNAAAESDVGQVENFYSWEWGSGLFIVLDPFRYTVKRPRQRSEKNKDRNDQWDPWDRTLGKAQYDWLQTTLERNNSRFKFVFLHHLAGGVDRSGRGGIEVVPYFEWGGKNLDGKEEFDEKRPGWGLPIHDLLVKHRVSVVFHGHDHLFVKQDLDGIVYQEVPQPGYPRPGNVRSAAEYGYLSGEIQSSSGYLCVHVSPDAARVDYVRSYLAGQESPQRKNGDVSYSYVLNQNN